MAWNCIRLTENRLSLSRNNGAMVSALRSLVIAVVGLWGAIALHPILPLATPFIPSSVMATVMAREIPTQERVLEIEETWRSQYTDYFGDDRSGTPLTALEIRTTLARLNLETRTQFALIYIFPNPDGLELVALVPSHAPVRLTFPNVPRSVLDPVMDDARTQATRPIVSNRHLESAQQLYDWMVRPLESYLDDWNVDTVIFCVGTGVRSLPLAMLHDGERFLVESYGISIIPAFSLIDGDYDRVNRTQVLAMGASQFQDLQDLPAVPVELEAIAQDLWSGDVFLNEAFTQNMLRQQLGSGNHAIVHLATHAAFYPGEPDMSYIQLWNDEQLHLDELAALGWRDRPVNLLVLSACQTALGNPQAELGFAGLAYHVGVQSTLASLWQVSDIGTLALMREFYWHLAQPDVTTKTEALRRSQQAMIEGQVYVADGYLHNSSGRLALPASLEKFSTINLSLPFYWAGFTLVGSPW